MLVVSNTSPISNLASIGRLDLLKSQFPVLWIPAGVAAELASHPDPTAAAAIQSGIRGHWIRTATVKDSRLLHILLLDLHRGEAEAIALASDMSADMVLIDEQEGREIAAEAGLSVTGVLGVLLRAKQTGEIAAVKPEIQSLRDRARFFISPALEARVLASAAE
jgi:predicted nucleic acid-binding protein